MGDYKRISALDYSIRLDDTLGDDKKLRTSRVISKSGKMVEPRGHKYPTAKSNKRNMDFN